MLCEMYSIIGKNSSFDDFRTTPHKLAWIVNIRPDITAVINILLKIQKITANKKKD